MTTPSASSLPPGVPPEAAAFLDGVGYFLPDRLHAGDIAPRMVLSLLESGAPVEIGAPDRARPTVLIFGSYT